MLVLTRKKKQSCIIDVNGTLVEVQVVSVRGDRVRLGFIGDDSIRFDRKEVFEARKVQTDAPQAS